MDGSGFLKFGINPGPGGGGGGGGRGGAEAAITFPIVTDSLTQDYRICCTPEIAFRPMNFVVGMNTSRVER